MLIPLGNFTKVSENYKWCHILGARGFCYKVIVPRPVTRWCNYNRNKYVIGTNVFTTKNYLQCSEMNGRLYDRLESQHDS